MKKQLVSSYLAAGCQLSDGWAYPRITSSGLGEDEAETETEDDNDTAKIKSLSH